MVKGFSNSTFIARLASGLLASVAVAELPFFEGVGALPNAQFGSSAVDISEDGSAVLGNSDEGLSSIAFRWKAGVITSLGHFPGNPIMISEAGGVSADGSSAAAVGISLNGTEGFRWDSNGIAGLGDLRGGPFYSHAFEISGGGDVIVGVSRTEVGDFPFHWRAGVMTNLSIDFIGEVPTGFARSISDDGEVVVGTILTSVGPQLFRWNAGVMTDIAFPDGSNFASARSLSADGSIMVGQVTFSETHTEAFRWENSGYQFLGDLPGGALHSEALDVSADGSMVVGVSSGSNGLAPFIWNSGQGMRDLDNHLRNQLNFNLDGWSITEAVAISGDGRTIAGNGINPMGKREGWIANIGCAIGDLNTDGDADLDDYAAFSDCLGGPGQAPNPSAEDLNEQICLQAFDFDCNDRLDLIDAAMFQRVYDGP
jgi:uncharacterized membrane protein